MKRTLLLSFITLAVFACKKKEEITPLYKVKFSITGTSVNQFKFNSDALAASITMATPFTGTKDTTIYLGPGKVVSLDGKATATAGKSLVGRIYINDTEVALQTDADADGDGKTAVHLDYTLTAH